MLLISKYTCFHTILNILIHITQCSFSVEPASWTLENFKTTLGVCIVFAVIIDLKIVNAKNRCIILLMYSTRCDNNYTNHVLHNTLINRHKGGNGSITINLYFITFVIYSAEIFYFHSQYLSILTLKQARLFTNVMIKNITLSIDQYLLTLTHSITWLNQPSFRSIIDLFECMLPYKSQQQ